MTDDLNLEVNQSMEVEISSEKITAFREVIINWEAENYVNFPWRVFKNRWYSLVVEIMLQRTRAEQVEPIFKDFCVKYPTPEIYLADEQSDVFATLGLPEREKQLKAAAKQIVIQGIPVERDELLKLPGVGDYIASAFRSLHLGIRDRIIDSNVVRLYGRIFGFLTHGETRRKKWFIKLAEDLTPLENYHQYNYGLLDFTRAICTPKPNCEICPLKSICLYYNRILGGTNQ